MGLDPRKGMELPRSQHSMFFIQLSESCPFVLVFKDASLLRIA